MATSTRSCCRPLEECCRNSFHDFTSASGRAPHRRASSSSVRCRALRWESEAQLSTAGAPRCADRQRPLRRAQPTASQARGGAAHRALCSSDGVQRPGWRARRPRGPGSGSGASPSTRAPPSHASPPTKLRSSCSTQWFCSSVEKGTLSVVMMPTRGLGWSKPAYAASFCSCCR